MQNEKKFETLIDIKSMLPEELEQYFISIGLGAFRGRQVFKWLRSGAVSFEKMTNLPKELRERLEREFFIHTAEIERKQVSSVDGTIKYLWRLSDGSAVESVVMGYEHGNTVCISSQVGCRMGCVFCASSIGGLHRNLSPSEMEDQVFLSQSDSGKKISNIVLMGIGEPLDNFDNVVRFLQLIRHPEGMNVGARHISLSTCGITENIDKLASLDIQLTLTVSLHAPDDETRSLLMPVNAVTGVDELFKACSRYFEKTGRRVSYEYAMIDGVNDSAQTAALLAAKLRGTQHHLNLILLSHTPQTQMRASRPAALKAFCDVLRKKGVNFTLRRSLGSDIDASCGQLREKHLSRKNS